MTGEMPFQNIRSPVEILQLVSNGGRPARPNRKLVHYGLDDRLWSLITRCWSHDVSLRPSAAQVLEEINILRQLPTLDVRDLSHHLVLDEDIHSVSASGGFGEIRRGVVNGFGPVALKTLIVKNHMQPSLRLTKVRFDIDGY